MILLKLGDKKVPEGYAPLRKVLAEDDGDNLYPRAIEPLLAAKQEVASELALRPS